MGLRVERDNLSARSVSEEKRTRGLIERHAPDMGTDDCLGDCAGCFVHKADQGFFV